MRTAPGFTVRPLIFSVRSSAVTLMKEFGECAPTEEQALISVFLTAPSHQTLRPLRNPVLFLTFLLWSGLIWAGVVRWTGPLTLEVMRMCVSPLGRSVWWWPELLTHVQLFFIWSILSPRTWVWWCAATCAWWVLCVLCNPCLNGFFTQLLWEHVVGIKQLWGRWLACAEVCKDHAL